MHSRITTQVLDSIYVSVATERSTVSIDASLVACAVCAESTLTHYGLTDDEGRAVLLLLGSIERLHESELRRYR